MPALSPNTQAMMQPPPTGEDAKKLFEDGFGQMAQNVLNARYPDLIPQVVTFQVLTSDLDSGSAVGVFVLARSGKTLHIPVILANNQVKPIEIMFDKDNGMFLPLQPGWLEEIDRSNLDVLGEGVKPPKDMVTDLDIRNLVVPPASGRYTYASDMSAKGAKLTSFLRQAPNYVKEAFHKVLTTNRRVLKFASENYDMADIAAALRPQTVKTADVGSVSFLTPDSGIEQFREKFGAQAGQAYQAALQRGYVVKDSRPFFKVAMETQETVWLHEAKEPGFYRLKRVSGETVDALVIPNPRGLAANVRHSKYTGGHTVPDPYLKRVPAVAATQEINGVSRYPGPEPKYLIFTENRDIITTDTPPVGRLLPEYQVSPKLLNSLKAQGTPNSGFGIFVRYEAGKASSTVPVTLNRVTTGSDGIRRMEAQAHDDPTTFGPKTIVTDPKSPIRQIVAPKDSSVVYMPPTFKFLGGQRTTGDFLKTAQGTDLYSGMLKKAGATKVRLLNAKGGMFGIGRAAPQTKLATLKQLVINLGLREPEARLLLEKTASKSKHEFFLVSPVQMVKFAMLCQQHGEGIKLAQPPVPGDPNAQAAPPPMDPSMDPAMAGGDPSMMGAPPMDPAMMAPPPPPPPPPPDPVNVAVTEIGSQLASQAADVARQLAEQQRDLSNQLAVLDAVQQRAQQVAAEQSGMPPLPPEAEVGAPPEAGMPPAPTMGPSPVPTMPPVGAPPPGMPPQPGMAPPPGMPGMAPPMEQPMSSEQLAAESGPMMEGAAGLAPFGPDEANEAFEATAIGSMATNPDLRGVVSLYLPALEDSLDHLARILLTLWMQEDQYRTELGEKDFSELEERLRTVLSNLGKLVLRINQTAMAAKVNDEASAKS